MTNLNRRSFLGMGGVAALGVGVNSAFANGGSAGAMGGADSVVLNARVYTSDKNRPGAEAFAVKDGYFLAVGSNQEVRKFITSETEVLDASGQIVTPGFIDAHTHPVYAGVYELMQMNMDLRSIADIQNAIRKKAAVTPAGEWILGFKYDDTKTAEGRRLTRKDLDEATLDHPVFILHRGGHTAYCNSKAFEKANITKNTPDPFGGKIVKANGELDGMVAESAMGLFDLPEESTRAQRQQAVKLITGLMSAAGLTSVQDAGASPSDAVAYQDALHADELKCRVYMLASSYEGSDMYSNLKAAGVYSGFGNEWLRVGGVKFGADGSASERTMRMSTPYVGRPNDYGILTMTQEEIDRAVDDAFENRFQVGIHANGDVAIDMVLKAYERVKKKAPRADLRPRIEHCSLVNPDLLRRIKAVGAIPTPFYTYAHYHGNKWVEYGEEKMEWMFAHRSFLDYDIPVAAASDYIPGPFEPLMAIQSMVTRKDYKGRVWGPSQRITVEQALRICTINSAYASFEEHIKGSITPGKLADFVLLADDPHKVNPDTIKHIPIVRTVVGGKTMYLS